MTGLFGEEGLTLKQVADPEAMAAQRERDRFTEARDNQRLGITMREHALSCATTLLAANIRAGGLVVHDDRNPETISQNHVIEVAAKFETWLRAAPPMELPHADR